MIVLLNFLVMMLVAAKGYEVVRNFMKDESIGLPTYEFVNGVLVDTNPYKDITTTQFNWKHFTTDPELETLIENIKFKDEIAKGIEEMRDIYLPKSEGV